MDPMDVLRSRSLAIASLLLAAILLAIGVQRAALATGDVESDVLVPLTVAGLIAALLVFGGLAGGNYRRTPYW